MILIVAHDADLHGTEVIARLDEAGMPWRRLDPSRLQRDWLYSIDPVNGGVETGHLFSSLRSAKAGSTGGSEVFHAIYWRRPVEHEHATLGVRAHATLGVTHATLGVTRYARGQATILDTALIC